MILGASSHSRLDQTRNRRPSFCFPVAAETRRADADADDADGADDAEEVARALEGLASSDEAERAYAAFSAPAADPRVAAALVELLGSSSRARRRARSLFVESAFGRERERENQGVCVYGGGVGGGLRSRVVGGGANRRVRRVSG